MQTGYFNAAWQDIKNSPGWFGKLLLLSLVGLIPIFGWIVVLGYLLGWARDIAWNVHGPLPARIFGNEDGKLYSRGFFALVIGFVCLLIPWVLEMVWGLITGFGFGYGWSSHGHGMFALSMGLSSMVFSLLVLAASFIAVLFSGVGAMRMSIYGRLAPGLQFGKLWAMVRHDFGGLLRIVGMCVLLCIVMSIVAWVLLMVIVLVGLLLGLIATGGNMNLQAVHPDSSVWGMAFAIGGSVAVLVALYGVLGMVMGTFVTALLVRALGYWTRQFDVPAWRGQDDPMPFELAGGSYGGQPRA